MENQNTPKYLDKTQTQLFEVLKQLPHAPSVQYSTAIPHEVERLAIEANPDERISRAQQDAMRVNPGEFYENDKDQDPSESATKRLKTHQPMAMDTTQ